MDNKRKKIEEAARNCPIGGEKWDPPQEVKDNKMLSQEGYGPENRIGLSSGCTLDPLIVFAIFMMPGKREHPCDRCNEDRKICRGYPKL